MDQLPVNLADVQTFFLVVDTGSFMRAAERLNTSKSKASRQVSRLEDALRVRLLTRSTKGVQMTDAGTRYYARAKAALNELEAAGEDVVASTMDIAGPIRITGPASFGLIHLADSLVEFAVEHPRIEFDMVFTDQRVDLIHGGFDLGVRIGKLEDSSLISRTLGTISNMTVASPAYLQKKGRPEKPEDLSTHEGIYYANTGAADMWRYEVKGKVCAVKVPVRMRADNGETMLKAAVAGLGVARMPGFIVREAVAAGQVEPILTDYETAGTGLHIIMPPGRASIARIRTLVDFLLKKYRTADL